jgi:molecular chaperone DnaK
MRGAPQIEVTLDIDANGIMNVSAKDKTTGKENKITIKANSGLSDAEIQRMVQEAAENAESDAKAKTLIEARNNAEGTVHSIKKDYDTHKEQLTEEERTAFESAVKTVDESVAGEDPEAIQKAVEALFESASPVMAKKQAAEAAATNPQTGEQTVDASFTEVDKTDTE